MQVIAYQAIIILPTVYFIQSMLIAEGYGQTPEGVSYFINALIFILSTFSKDCLIWFLTGYVLRNCSETECSMESYL